MMKKIITLVPLIFLGYSQTYFDKGSVSYQLDQTQVQLTLTTLVLSLQLNFTLPSQMFVDVSLPSQLGSQTLTLCAVQGQFSTICSLLNQVFVFTFKSPQQNTSFVFYGFDNPLSNYTDNLIISGRGPTRATLLFSTQVQLQFTVMTAQNNFLLPTFQFPTPTTLQSQNLTITFSNNIIIPSGGFYQINFPEILTGSGNFLISSKYSSILPTTGFSASASFIINNGNLQIFDNFGSSKYELTITNFTTPAWTQMSYNIPISIQDQYNNFIALDSTNIIMTQPDNSLYINLVPSNQRAQAISNFTFTITQKLIPDLCTLRITSTGAVRYNSTTLVVEQIIQGQTQPQILNSTIKDNQQIDIPIYKTFYQQNTITLDFLNVQNQIDSATPENFTFIIMDASNHQSQTGSITYTAIPEQISNITLNLSNYVVNTPSSYTFTIQPKLYSSNRTIIIDFPQELLLTQQVQISLIPNDIKVGTQITGQTITISNIQEPDNSQIQILITQVMNPKNTCQIGEFNFKILTDNKILETSLFSPFLQYQSQNFTVINLNQSSAKPQQLSDLYFQVNHQYQFSSNDVLIFQIPIELGILASSNFLNFKQLLDFTSTITQNNTIISTCQTQASNQVKCINLQGISNTGPYNLILKNILLPRSLGPTQPLTGSLTEGSCSVANFNGQQIQLFNAQIINFTVSSNSYTLGSSSIWDIIIYTDQFNLIPNDVILVQTPQFMTISSAQCRIQVPQDQIINCNINQGLQQILLINKFTIPQGSYLQFKILSLLNPDENSNDMQWNIRISDMNSYLISNGQYLSPSWQIRQFNSSTLNLSNIYLGQIGDLTVNFSNTYPINSGGQFSITFNPSQFSYPSTFTCLFNNQNLTCNYQSGVLKFQIKINSNIGSQMLIIPNTIITQMTAPIALNLNYMLQSYDSKDNLLEQSNFTEEVILNCLNSCNSCQKTFDNCVSCNSGLVQQQNTCIDQCIFGWVSRDSICYQCQMQQNCIQCDPMNFTKCVLCSQSTFMDNNGNCVNIVDSTNQSNQSNVNTTNKTSTEGNNLNITNQTTDLTNQTNNKTINDTTINDTTVNDTTINDTIQPNSSQFNNSQTNMTIKVLSNKTIQQTDRIANTFTVQVIDIYPVLSSLVVGVFLLVLIRKLFYRKTRLITLCYSLFLLIIHLLEVIIVAKLFISDYLIFGLGSLSLIIIHMIEQIFSLTQIALTLKIDPTYQTFIQQYKTIKAVHLIENLFCFRFVIIMFSRLDRGPQWDGQWINRIFIINQIISLIRISVLYNMIFVTLMGTFIFLHNNKYLSLIYYESFAFTSLMLLLDVYHILFLKRQEALSYRIQAQDKTNELDMVVENMIDIDNNSKNFPGSCNEQDPNQMKLDVSSKDPIEQ